MKKFILLLLIFGNPLTTGYFDAPTGERVFWKWFDKELIVMDSNGSCLANSTGKPKQCTLRQFSKMLNNLY